MEGQQFVAVVFILFPAQSDLGGQADIQVVDQGVEAVNATLRFASITTPSAEDGTDITPLYRRSVTCARSVTEG